MFTSPKPSQPSLDSLHPLTTSVTSASAPVGSSQDPTPSSLSSRSFQPSDRKTSAPSAFAHPLEPLTADEIRAAVSILCANQPIESHWRFGTITLHEPPKATVLNFRSGDPIDREAFMILLDPSTGSTYETIVSITSQSVRSWTLIAGVQPALMNDEMQMCESIIRSHPDFQAALKRRGVTDVDQVMIEYWSAGHYGIEAETSKRLLRGLCFLRSAPDENGFARPIEGVIPVVDLNRMAVVEVEDHGIVPFPPQASNYARPFVNEFRSDLKPLEITQPQGPSFEVDHHQVCWQKWQFRIGFTPREGLILHTIGYEDQGRIRPIIYRASLAEMVVPYGDPRPPHVRKNAFDVGEYAIGTQTNSLRLGCDCLGEIYYFDAIIADSLGQPLVIPNAICMHEEDFGVLWKHTDWRTEKAEVRRSRRLVVSFFTTVGNYDYGFFWYFYQDGTIQFDVKLTGILHTIAVHPGEDPVYGTLVAPQLVAPIHQHFFNMRLDMQVDGETNSVYEVHTEAVPLGPENPYGNAFKAKSTLLKREQEAQQVIDPLSGRYWKVVNPTQLNAIDQPVGYKLIPDHNVMAFAHPEASVRQRAGFIAKHLWVTPYDPDQMYPAGKYPNQHPGGDGLPAWSQANRSIESTDLVLWYTFGAHHLPRPEDWPVMPVAYAGFSLKPIGFFDRNPALDVPPPPPKHSTCCSKPAL